MNAQAKRKPKRTHAWKRNPACLTPRAVESFRALQAPRVRLAELHIDNTDPPADHPDSDLYRGP